eukprot:CAMPEP_0119007442 /NCGR_PEP_ID=MMETSP1176-20130426/3009_1 /TAXON_ID=265551 /ORGANISM="Synedropsis recta cf, Strain CCMP1620" /LENGTH=948 /DNA_ID=CAMNT_0006959593 /DNA_START=112 /DNA_END=2958 /DNA_ORIENTATION=+
MSAPATTTVPQATPRPILPSRGMARVKSVLSGDTVILLGKASSPDARPPEVVFTFEKVSAPRIASKGNNNIDEPGAFPAREWLRQRCVGKSVSFETRKQGATAGDRVYGLLFMADEATGTPTNLAVECIRNGYGTPKIYPPKENKDGSSGDDNDDPNDPAKVYEAELKEALEEAQKSKVGIHGESPLVRKIRNAGDDFTTLDLVEKSKKLTTSSTIKCVIEYVFDGSRMRCHVTDSELGDLQYANFTLLLGGVSCPRFGNTRVDPPTAPEPHCEEARQFVELRLLQRELTITLHGTDKSGICAVGTVHHPKGSIAVELLKNGLAKMSEWSVRLIETPNVPALRIAENGAKRTNLKVWKDYAPQQLHGDAEIVGTVIEVVTGDTLSILPTGQAYDSESALKKVSLASIRAPRVGNERMQRPDEDYAHECKERLRLLCVGKQVKVCINYERDIPMGENTEKRQFGTVSVGKRDDVGEVLVTEGLATTQRHRDDDPKSSRYDELVAAESAAKIAKKGLHSEKEYKRGAINDLSDPRKAKAYSESLMRAKTMKAIVEFCFNGARMRMWIPSENCHITFSPDCLRCPQSSPSPGSRAVNAKAAEPFGDESKRHARLTVLQRSVEISCSGVSKGGVITGTLFVGQGGQRRNYGLELVAAGLATVDQRKMDWGEAPKDLVDAQLAAQANKIGIWSLEQQATTTFTSAKSVGKTKEESKTVQLSEIVSGSHFYYRVVGDEAAKTMDESMRIFTENNGTTGATCDVRPGKVIAALFDDSSGKAWYRAKVVERGDKGRVRVLFVDHGNTASVPIATHLRPLDMTLGTDRVPAVAKEAMLALTLTRSLNEDDGMEAAQTLQSMAWGKDLTARVHCDLEGKLQVSLLLDGDDTSINETLVAEGLARVAKPAVVEAMKSRMMDNNSIVKLAADLTVAQETARKSRTGVWRYGDIGDDDEEE